MLLRWVSPAQCSQAPPSSTRCPRCRCRWPAQPRAQGQPITSWRSVCRQSQWPACRTRPSRYRWDPGWGIMSSNHHVTIIRCLSLSPIWSRHYSSLCHQHRFPSYRRLVNETIEKDSIVDVFNISWLDTPFCDRFQWVYLTPACPQCPVWPQDQDPRPWTWVTLCRPRPAPSTWSWLGAGAPSLGAWHPPGRWPAWQAARPSPRQSTWLSQAKTKNAKRSGKQVRGWKSVYLEEINYLITGKIDNRPASASNIVVTFLSISIILSASVVDLFIIFFSKMPRTYNSQAGPQVTQGIYMRKMRISNMKTEGQFFVI